MLIRNPLMTNEVMLCHGPTGHVITFCMAGMLAKWVCSGWPPLQQMNTLRH